MRIFYILFALIITLNYSCQQEGRLPDDADDKTLIKVGDVLQQTRLTDIDSNEYVIGQNAKRPTILYFFAPWCGYCQKTTPKIQALQDEIGEKIQILAIAREEGIPALQEWRNTVSYNLTLIPDADRSFYAQFAEAYIPRIFVLNKKGKVVFTHIAWEDDVPDRIKTALLSMNE